MILGKIFKKKYFVSKEAMCDSLDIGEGTYIRSFSHVLKGAKIGKDCNICESVFIENKVIIGDRVTIKNGVQIWDGITIEDDVFIGPNTTFTNDRNPKSKNIQYVLERTVVKSGASIGANATILPGLVIGEMSLVGAGAVVTRNVEPFTVVVGNPARELPKMKGEG
jgi:acetyltransferase-like isoleucine patch superfamily enzyme